MFTSFSNFVYLWK